MQTDVKTFEEHCEYVKELTCLSLFYVKKYLQERCPESTLGDLIRRHAPVFHHVFNVAPEDWDTAPECLAVYKAAEERKGLSPEDFKHAMWEEVIASIALKKAEELYPNVVGVKSSPGWNCGCLKYDPPQPNGPEGQIFFHIGNTIGPKSILAEKGYLAACFDVLMREAEIRFDAKILFTNTWLNERPDFLAFFPEEWQKNLSPRKEDPIPAWHLGWWGQMITGRGTLNPKTAAFLQENGYMKYEPRSSVCSFESMRKHLRENFL